MLKILQKPCTSKPLQEKSREWQGGNIHVQNGSSGLAESTKPLLLLKKVKPPGTKIESHNKMQKGHKVAIGVFAVACVALALYVSSRKEGEGEGLFGSKMNRMSGGHRVNPFS